MIRSQGDRALDEPPFREVWEGRTFALMIVTGVKGLRAGSIRPAIEEIEPAVYLASSYFERWARAVEAGLVAGGSVTAEEIDARSAALAQGSGPERAPSTDPELLATLPRLLDHPMPTSGETVAAAFRVGDWVTVRRMAPSGHHRCPRYVRGVTGTVERVNGGWPPPGDEAAALEAVYRVRFGLRDLWGEDAEPGVLLIDLWERYLSPGANR